MLTAAPDISEIWTDYKLTGDVKLRNKLVEQYLHVVPVVAEKLKHRLPASVSTDDLCQWGSIGLMDAVEKFEPQRNIRFSTYAMIRIRGAMLDGMRKHILDNSRNSNTRARNLEYATNAFAAQHGYPPTHDELQNRLALNDKQFKKCVDDPAVRVKQLSDIVYNDGNGVEKPQEWALIDQRHQPDPTDQMDVAQIITIVLDEVDISSALILRLYYLENWMLHDIAIAFHVSESRISQRHKALMGWLRDRMTTDTTFPRGLN